MDRPELLASFHDIRRVTECLCQPLLTEDYVVQPILDVSPPKWHLGHTTWFFEQVLLQQFARNYRLHHERYSYIFNSYYQSFGERVARELRGTLSRPSVKEVYAYRAAVDESMHELIETVEEQRFPEFVRWTELGLHHEQQHHEILVADIKHIFASNPLRPTYRTGKRKAEHSPEKLPRAVLPPAKLIPIAGGIFEIGARKKGFAWDNERPRHKVLLNDFQIMDRLVTCGEYLEFIRDGGYRNPLLWLSDGWDNVLRAGWQAPLYWEQMGRDNNKRDNNKNDLEWQILTLSGVRPLNPEEPVARVSFYEADACARWAGKRLPTEEEWERAATTVKALPSHGNFLEEENFHPVPYGQTIGTDIFGLSQMFGDVWEWTNSAYLPYPGYQQERGPFREYNGKFMSNQMVLRGGACATPRNHIRPTYRNFFQSDKRWQFTGFRLAADANSKE